MPFCVLFHKILQRCNKENTNLSVYLKKDLRKRYIIKLILFRRVTFRPIIRVLTLSENLHMRWVFMCLIKYLIGRCFSLQYMRIFIL